jgi:hypothetical protein
MVKSENIALPLDVLQSLIKGGHLERHQSGGWTLILELDGEIAIDGVRTLPIQRETHIGKLVQKGRRPLPAHVQESLKKGLRAKPIK